MKIALSFICGVAVCGLIIIGVKPVLPAMADESVVSDNETSFLSDLLPDVEKIYREALTAPFARAQAKIQDPDIAEYYNDLMDKTGLTDPNSD